MPNFPSEDLPLVPVLISFALRSNPEGRGNPFAWKDGLTDHVSWKRSNHLLLQIRDLGPKREGQCPGAPQPDSWGVGIRSPSVFL